MDEPRIFLIGRRFAVVPFVEDAAAGRARAAAAAAERVPLFIARGKAFGSGGHETTAACLEELEALPVEPAWRVLDLGCGTGILGIAAAALGAGSVAAVDIDADAVRSAARSVRLNGAGAAVRVVRGELAAVARGRFDLILANVYGDILIALAGDIPPLLSPGGYYLASGIRHEDAFEIRTRAAAAGLRLLRGRGHEDFCTLLFRRQNV